LQSVVVFVLVADERSC